MRIADARAPLGVVAMLLVACAVAFVLSGCASTPNPVPTSAVPTTAPVFATEEEALAAATEAYAAYQARTDLIFSEGGNDPSRIAEVVTPELAELEIQSFEQAKLEGLRSVGLSSFSRVELQSFTPSAKQGEDAVSLYLCSDISQVDILGLNGESVVGSDRADVTPFEVVFVLGADDSLLVSSRTVWTGSGTC